MQDVAAQLIFSHDFRYAFLRAIECSNGGDLNGCEGTVVVIALDFCQRCNQGLVSHHETDAPTGHVVAFGHGEKFDGYIARAGHLHDRWRLPAIEGNVRIGQIVDDQHIVVFGQRDDALEKIKLNAHCCRVRGKTQDQHFRLRIGLTNRPLRFFEKINTLRHPYMLDLRAGDDRAVDMYRIAGIRHQHRVTTVECCQHQMCKALFGADGDNRFCIWIEFNVVATLVPIGDRFAQAWDAFGH